MKKIIISLVFAIFLSFTLNPIVKYYLGANQPTIIYITIVGVILFLCMYFIVTRICYYMKNLFLLTNSALTKSHFTDLVIKLSGIFLGVVFWNALSIPINSIPNYIFESICLLGKATFGFLGYLIFKLNVNSIKEILSKYFLKDNNVSKDKIIGFKGIPKILDTSVIIDGRIYDICKSGFIEGELIIPDVVLEELRHIADSSDTLKRNRGRRGLDVLKNIQSNMPVRIEEVKDMEGMEVDSMLLKLAKNMNAKVITNDYNLNKVAAVQKVEVLNINELANCIKSIVLPGEEMIVKVMKDGKENGQGVAYLEDGTMIVVEGGKCLIGRNQVVIVTSVLQTAAGRMIFAKPKEEENVS